MEQSTLIQQIVTQLKVRCPICSRLMLPYSLLSKTPNECECGVTPVYTSLGQAGFLIFKGEDPIPYPIDFNLEQWEELRQKYLKAKGIRLEEAS